MVDKVSESVAQAPQGLLMVDAVEGLTLTDLEHRVGLPISAWTRTFQPV